jgi:regulator of protease activity HflC (stomatin/prohibitin superfamily)
MTGLTGLTLLIVVAALVVLTTACVRVLREYERAVVFRLGRLRGRAAKGPGPLILLPFVDRMVRVDLRTVAFTIPPQEVITRDNVPARVNAVAYFKVIDPVRAVLEVETYQVATSQSAQTALRSVLGHVDLDALLADREQLNERLRTIVDEQTEPWGLRVSSVEIKDVEIPEAMQRAMARQAEAERERRAKVINADGEFQAAGRLTEASQILARSPSALQLRYLQTLLEIGADQNTTVVFPLPMDLIRPFLSGLAPTEPGDEARDVRANPTANPPANGARPAPLPDPDGPGGARPAEPPAGTPRPSR